jgi:ferritin-like metal-binding protein YciE
VGSCIRRYGEEPSGGKDLLGTISSAIAGMGISLMHDKAVKNVHSSYAAEHTEIATYTVIRAAASEAGDMETVSVCDEILEDEKEMADFLLEQMPTVVNNHLKQM